jgi:hypothetical protein
MGLLSENEIRPLKATYYLKKNLPPIRSDNLCNSLPKTYKLLYKAAFNILRKSFANGNRCTFFGKPSFRSEI